MSKHQALQQLGSDIRRLSKEIKALQRALYQPPSSATSAPAGTKSKDKEKESDKGKTMKIDSRPATAPGNEAEDTKEGLIEQQTKLEEEKRRLELKYEQASGAPYDAPGEHKVLDFLELLFEEIDRPDRRSTHFLPRFYDPLAVQQVVGHAHIRGKDDIAASLLRRYEGLRTGHRIGRVEVESSPEWDKTLLLYAQVVLLIQIEEDRPRKVLQIIECVRSKESVPFEYVIKRERLVVQDARPLFHLPELPPPISRSPHMVVKEERGGEGEEKKGGEEKGGEEGGEGESDEEEGDEEESEEGEDEEDEEEEGEDEEEGDEVGEDDGEREAEGRVEEGEGGDENM